MSTNQDEPLLFHDSFNELLDSFRFSIASATWLQVSVQSAQKFFEPYLYIINLPCSVTDKIIKLDKSIFNTVQKEGFNGPSPLYTKNLINFYRIFTIAVKDIIFEQQDFHPYLNKAEELKFLRHIRNASAHDNKFFWGRDANQRAQTIQQFPICWRSKVIEEKLEGNDLYMSFMKPGDIFMLLFDISNLVVKTS
ncbi:MAG: hypothetical protein V1712_02975 [Patescibacteria group bacterium]